MTDAYYRETEPQAGRGIFGWLLLPISLFPLIALLTYDWHAIAALNLPAAESSNWVGALGDAFAYHGYFLLGFAIWLVPLFCLLAGLVYATGHRTHTGLRKLWLLVFITAAACLVEAAAPKAPGIAAFLRRINTENAGGCVGYLLMTRLLMPSIGIFGAVIIAAIAAAASLIGALGVQNILGVLKALWTWCTAGLGAPVPPVNGTPEDEARYIAEQAQYQAALQARADAKRQAAEKKAADRAAKEAEKAARAAEKEAARNAALAAHEAEAAEREAELERIRAAREAAKRSSVTQTARLQTIQPPKRPDSQATKPQTQTDQAAEPQVEDKGPYILPSVNLLAPVKASTADHSDVGEMSQRLVDTLKLFGVDAKVSYTVQGPVVTKYAIELAPGTRYTSVTNLQDNLKGALHAKSLRIEAPIPGEDRIGIEVPNRAPAGIGFREIFESEAWKGARAELPLLFGKRADGKELVADLASMPHMLVAGATGQGKSVCLNSLICGLLMTRTPEQLKLIMVDPKCVEFTPYASIPHLLVPVITDNRKVVFSLHWAVAEMEKRLKLFARAKVRNIYDFNHRPMFTQTDMFGDDTQVGSDIPKTVPYIVIIIDEAADLIGQCGKEVNPDIQRITQKARAAGIHLILATQRPDAKIITGAIKANIPGRVAFKTSSSVDSRTILDDTGAENLIGKGDMLFKGKDGLLIRAQGAWISDGEIANVTNFIEQHSNVQFDDRFTKKLGTIKEEEIDIYADDTSKDNNEDAKAEAAAAKEQVKAAANASDFKKAVECVINTRRASTSHFQRQMGWGYNHAAKILDMLEAKGIVAPASGMGPRQIVMDQDQLIDVLNGDDGGETEAPTEANGETDGNEAPEPSEPDGEQQPDV